MALPETPRKDEFLRLMQSRLPEKKARHCIGVAELLVRIAGELKLPEEEAVAAGLLHDLFRTCSNEVLLEEAQSRDVEIDAQSEATPILLHGPVAAAYCRSDLGIDNEAILEAIYWHTTGTAGLGLLGQALYLADFAEPNRRYPEATEARNWLESSGFEAALRYAVEAKAGLSRMKKNTHPHGEAFRRWVLAGRPDAGQ